MITDAQADAILQSLAATDLRGFALRKAAMEQLDALEDYDWSGIYRLEGDTLVLDAYVGAATDHTRIPVGVGVCGTAVHENANQIVHDVREIQNYLSCSVSTRSEIVVLIRRGDAVLGQIDIDGHRVGAFDTGDEVFLDRLAVLLAERWED